ncbi:MAG: CHRD domain-containing protein, partial [Actinomycetota bacterium]|nr:CHRD domain-containing protein [Actinomycetota bacterium]
FELSVSGIAAADKAHVHRGPADQAGPVVVNLTPPAEGTAEGCVDAPEGLVREILAGPGAFYVNVHNRPFPAGALRGQLAA